MSCGHDVMLDQPEELAEELLALSSCMRPAEPFGRQIAPVGAGTL